MKDSITSSLFSVDACRSALALPVVRCFLSFLKDLHLAVSFKRTKQYNPLKVHHQFDIGKTILESQNKFEIE